MSAPLLPYYASALVDTGREALTFFHNFQVVRYGDAWPYQSVDELIDNVRLQKGARFVDEYVGDVVQGLGLTLRQVEDAMSSLSKASGGKVPHWQAFGDAMSNRLQNYTFLEVFDYVATNSAGDIVKGVAEAGDAAIVTLRGLKWIVPALILGGVAWIGYSYIRRTAGR